MTAGPSRWRFNPKAPVEDPRRRNGPSRSAQVLLFLLLWFSYGYFAHGPGWGQVSRMNLVIALVDDGTLTLDRYLGATGDVAWYEGHAYHEKAPGGAVLGLLPYRLFSWVVPRPPLEVLDPGGPGEQWNPAWSLYYGRALYATTWLTTGLLSAAAGVLIFRLAWGLFGGALAALATALIYGLGTLVFAYAGQFQGHQMAGALLAVALYLTWRARSLSGSQQSLYLAGFGLAAAFAVATEYQDVVPAAAVGVYALIVVRPRRALGWAVLGAVPPALLVLRYNQLCFGAAWRLGYAQVGERWRELHEGALWGLGAPRGDVLWRMLFSRWRGLFVFSPALLLAAPGAVLWWRRRTDRTLLMLCLAVAIVFPVYLSGFRGVETGYQFGPRFLVPMVPFAALLMGAFIAHRGRWRRPAAVVAGALGLISGLFALAGTAVNPQFSPSVRDPLVGYLLPQRTVISRAGERGADPTAGHLLRALVAGDFPKSSYGRRLPEVPRPIEYPPFNLGMHVGLRDQASLAPLLAVWLAGMGLTAWLLRRSY